MTRCLTPAVVGAVCLLGALPARSETPLVVTHEGFLLDGSDRPVEAAALSLSFALFANQVKQDGEQARWQSGSCETAVTAGRYAVLLGGGDLSQGCGSALDLTAWGAGEQRFLEVTVGATTLAPRLRLSELPVATLALDARKLGGVDAALLVDGETGKVKQEALPASAVLRQELDGYLPLSGGTLSGAVSSAVKPLSDAHLVNKSYVDAYAYPKAVADDRFLPKEAATDLAARDHVHALADLTDADSSEWPGTTHWDRVKGRPDVSALAERTGLLEKTTGLSLPTGARLPDTSNCGLEATVAANALTVTLLAEDGSALSADNACFLRFRSAKATRGTRVGRMVEAPVSITVPHGTTLGTTSEAAELIHVYAVDVDGQVVLGLSLTAGHSRHKLSSTVLISTGSSPTTLYTATAHEDRATLYLGYLVAPQEKAGTWVSSPTEVSFTGPRAGRMGLPEARSVDTAYRAETDGVLWTGGSAIYYSILTGPSEMTMDRLVKYTEANGVNNGNGAQHTAPIAAGTTFMVWKHAGSTPEMYWIPLVD